VLQWQDGKLVDLAPPVDEPHMFFVAPAGGGRPLFPYGVHVEYLDENNDGLKEIVIVQLQNDNWGCTWTLRRIFGWNGTRYQFQNHKRDYEAVQGCEIRLAETAMWEDDYETAIEHYQQGLKLATTDEYFFGDPEELARYATTRLVLAYTLIGRDEEANTLIDQLRSREDDSQTLTEFIDAIRSNLGDASAMCQAAHDVFVFTCPFDTDTCLGSPLNTIVGYTTENSGYGVGHPALSFPAATAAGCDPVMPLYNELDAIPFDTDEVITKQLEARGLNILKSMQFDLNHDGVDEWLIWLTSPIPALFFMLNLTMSIINFLIRKSLILAL
jgi:hypothetical protein